MSLDNRYSPPLLKKLWSYEVAIVLCQRNERARTSLYSSLLHTAYFDNSGKKAETVAHAGDMIFFSFFFFCGMADN